VLDTELLLLLLGLCFKDTLPLVALLFHLDHHQLLFQVDFLILKVPMNLEIIEPELHGFSFKLSKLQVLVKLVETWRQDDLDLDRYEEIHESLTPELKQTLVMVQDWVLWVCRRVDFEILLKTQDCRQVRQAEVVWQVGVKRI